jgi:hypothetical protein
LARSTPAWAQDIVGGGDVEEELRHADVKISACPVKERVVPFLKVKVTCLFPAAS